jgi:prepilin-type N-terminal cleavage/methylation domain-containing protein
LTLIEMLVTIAVIGVGVVGIAYGFTAVVRSSGDTQEQATLDGAAHYLADYMQSDADVAYLACATSYTAPSTTSPSAESAAYLDDGVSWPSTFPVAVSSPNPTPGYASLDPCSASTDDYGVQEITITVTDHGISVTQVVWKDDLS